MKSLKMEHDTDAISPVFAYSDGDIIIGASLSELPERVVGVMAAVQTK